MIHFPGCSDNNKTFAFIIKCLLVFYTVGFMAALPDNAGCITCTAASIKPMITGNQNPEEPLCSGGLYRFSLTTGAGNSRGLHPSPIPKLALRRNFRKRKAPHQDFPAPGRACTAMQGECTLRRARRKKKVASGNCPAMTGKHFPAACWQKNPWPWPSFPSVKVFDFPLQVCRQDVVPRPGGHLRTFRLSHSCLPMSQADLATAIDVDVLFHIRNRVAHKEPQLSVKTQTGNQRPRTAASGQAAGMLEGHSQDMIGSKNCLVTLLPNVFLR